MSIKSRRKTWILAGVLVIIGGAAFVYFDPMDMDLLGLNKSSVVVQPVAPRHVLPVLRQNQQLLRLNQQLHPHKHKRPLPHLLQNQPLLHLKQQLRPLK